MSRLRNLSAKQQRFVDEYCSHPDLSAAAAAVRAGYAPASAKVTASRMLSGHNPVSRAIKARQAEEAERLALSRQDVIAGVLAGIAIAKAQGNAGAVIAGWVQVAKILGFYAPKIVNVDVAVNAQTDERRMQYKLQGMSDEELRAMIEGRDNPI